jgi:hypothetical protein
MLRDNSHSSKTSSITWSKWTQHCMICSRDPHNAFDGVARSVFTIPIKGTLFKSIDLWFTGTEVYSHYTSSQNDRIESRITPNNALNSKHQGTTSPQNSLPRQENHIKNPPLLIRPCPCSYPSSQLRS